MFVGTASDSDGGSYLTGRYRYRFRRISPLYPETGIFAARIQNYLFNLIHSRILRTGRNVVFERFDRFFRALCPGFNAAVRKVSDITAHLVACSDPLCEKPESHPLNKPAKQEFSRDHHQLDIFTPMRPGIPARSADGTYKPASREA